MNLIKWFFTSRYKKLLYQIEIAKNGMRRLCLPNGVLIDFWPGHEYDNCRMYVLPHEHDGKNFVKKYAESIGKVVHMDVYDCFGGDVRIIAVGADRVFVEIVNVLPCYDCQGVPPRGSKHWVGEWEIFNEESERHSVFTEEDLPF